MEGTTTIAQIPVVQVEQTDDLGGPFYTVRIVRYVRDGDRKRQTGTETFGTYNSRLAAEEAAAFIWGGLLDATRAAAAALGN